ncbi:MAG: hypothetical protein RXO36_07770, partial [Candidatus Nanopusillus acidilobi]
QETTVLHDLLTQGWALVYLKYSTSAPVPYGGTAPAIAAGPFNLTIRPTMKVTIKPLNNLSNVSLCLPTSQSAFLNITGTNAYTSGLINSTMSDLANYKLKLLGSFANSTVSTTSAIIADISKSSNSSEVFGSSIHVNYTSTPVSIGVKGTLDGMFIPPALTNSVHFSSGAVTSYFNISDFSLDVMYSKPITVAPAPGTTYVEFSSKGAYQYGTTTGAAAEVSFYPINYSLSNYGVSPSTFKPYGLFTPSPAAGTLNIFPSFEVTSENPGVAGSGYLNPGDELTLTFFNLPSGTSFVAVTAIGNGTLLPTSPYLYPAEENYESYYNSSGYVVESIGTFTNDSFTSAIKPVSSEATVNVLVPNAPYYPFAALGLEYEITYTPELVSGTISPYAYVSNCTLWYSDAPIVVYPFYQVFTSNANGYFIYNGTPEEAEAEGLLFGNYLLVRGFGFTTSITPSEYPAIVTIFGTAYSTLTPITSVQSDGYGDFAYVSQVPISGPFYKYLVTQIPSSGCTPTFNFILNPALTSIVGNSTFDLYLIYLNANPNASIVYVNPTPVVYKPTPIVTGLLGAIQMPTTLLKYPFEATQYIVNGTTHLIPVSNGTIGKIVVVGAGANANITTGKYGSVLLKFYIESNATNYYGFVNVSQVAPFGDSGFRGTWVLGGYGVFYNVPVPDLPGNAGWMPSGNYSYEIVITNVTTLSGKGTSEEPASTTLYVGKAAGLLIGTYSLAYMLTNYTTGAAVFYHSPLVTQPILVLPSTPITAYVFGSPISKPTGKALPVYFNVSTQCGVAMKKVLAGYIIDGTLFSNFTGKTGKYVKGSTLSAGTTLPLCPGYNELIFQLTGPYVPTGTNATYPSTPATLYLDYVTQIPTVPVQFSVSAPGTASVGVPVEVLVSSQVSVLGLPASEASTFFTVSAPQVTAYIANASGVYQLPASSVRFVAAIPGFDVYYVTLPSTVANGTVDIIVTVTAAYRFDPSVYTFTGQAAATSGIVSVNTQAINSEIASAESQVASLIQGLNASI